MRDAATARWYSDRHVRVSVPGRRAVATLCHHLATNAPPGLIDIVTGRDSLLLEFDVASIDDDRLLGQLAALAESWPSLAPPPDAAVCVVPFCADTDLAPDLAALAEERRITPAEFVRRFVDSQYTVEFVGFMPGFGYLTGLPEELAAARLESPRVRVPAGSVAIGGDRAGVYPFESSGGWRLIGRTNVRLFDPTRFPASLFSAGMKVRFELQDREVFDAEVKLGGRSI